MTNLSSFIVLGIMREQSLGIKRLIILAKTKHYRSFQSPKMRENNYIEIQFSRAEDVKQTLSTH
jgi:hypothetical protein